MSEIQTHLDSDVAKQCFDCALQVADYLVQQRDDEWSSNFDLANGLCGEALFLASCALHTKSRMRYLRAVEARMRRVEELIHEAPFIRPSLFTGIAGVSWVTKYIGWRLNIRDFRESDLHATAVELVDDFLDRQQRSQQEVEYDLIAGIVGIGIWALDLSRRSWNERVNSRVFELLRRQAESCEEGIRWRTPESRPVLYVSPDEDIEYNLGVAHGVPAIIGYLGLLVRADIQREEAQRLLEAAIDWLFTCRDRLSGRSLFPYIANGQQASRVAWCYGDPGIAAALTTANTSLKSPAVRELVQDCIEGIAEREPGTSGVHDAGICHGSSGLTMIYAYLMTVSRSDTALALYRESINQTLRYRGSAGLCGFRRWNGLDGEFDEHTGLLTGVSGIGLSLLSVATNDWTWATVFLSAEHNWMT